MKYFILSFFLWSCGAYAQQVDSIFTLQVGQKVCRFKYEVLVQKVQIPVDTIQLSYFPYYRDTVLLKDGRLCNIPKGAHIIHSSHPVSHDSYQILVKDSIVNQKMLTLIDTSTHKVNVRKPLRMDTLGIINPVTMEEEVHVYQYPRPVYHIQAAMTFDSLLDLIKSKFAFQNSQKQIVCSKVSIYYENSERNDFISSISYDDAASKLATLRKGGFALIYIELAGDSDIKINTHSEYLMRIDIKK